jgi:hypothetical protein
MKRPELMQELKKRNISFTVNMKNVELQELLDNSEKMIKIVKDDILGKDKMTVDELTEGAQRTEDGIKRKSGVIIPHEVLSKLSRTKFQYVADCTSEACQVKKIDHRGKEHDVRVYSKVRHGENFKDLAIMFVDKNNLKLK